MCYSVQVKSGVSDLARRLGALIDFGDFVRLYALRERAQWKLPDGLQQCLAEPDSEAGRSIERSVNEFRANDQQRKRAEIQSIEAEMIALEARLQVEGGKSLQQALRTKTRKLEKLLGVSGKNDDVVRNSYRIFPFYFAPVLIEREGGRCLVPMRYRILPRSGVEIPTRYNVFNARRDALRSARTWKSLFGKRHAIFPLARFYEWVECNGKKREICFTPDNIETLWAACLYEAYPHPAWGVIHSFAMLTDEPPPEVAAAGHDRCPIFLHEDCIDDWLAPAGKSLDYLDGLLEHRQAVVFSHM